MPTHDPDFGRYGPPQTQGPDPDPGEPKDQAGGKPGELNHALWLWYLYFQPKRFFEHFATEPSFVLTALCAWVFGMSGVIDRIEMQHTQGRLSMSEFGLSQGWEGYAALILAGGAFGGLMHYALGGWWYGKRLEWCGVERPEKRLVRRVYLYAAQIIAVPTVLITFTDAMVYNSPVEAMEAERGVWYMLFALFPLWSVWASYRGVRTVYDPPRVWRTRIWFILLPGVVYSMAIVVFAVAAFNTQLLEPPRLSRTHVFQNATFSFEYPGNWWLEDDPEADPEFYASVEAMQDAVALFYTYESSFLAGENLSQTLADLEQWTGTRRQESPCNKWGPLRGEGVTALFDIEGKPYRLLVLVASVGQGRYVEVREVCLVAHDGVAQPGFDLIRSTFRVAGARIGGP